MNENSNDNANDAKMWDIFIHKEQYGKTLLEEAELWLMCNGYSEECDELGRYIDSLEQENIDEYEEPEEYEYITRNNKTYHGSKSKVWTTYLKIICYFVWFINIALDMLIGGFIYHSAYHTNPIPGLILGALIGFFIGFLIIALAMTFITMCENIATTTDNTARILKSIDEIKNSYIYSEPR